MRIDPYFMSEEDRKAAEEEEAAEEAVARELSADEVVDRPTILPQTSSEASIPALSEGNYPRNEEVVVAASGEMESGVDLANEAKDEDDANTVDIYNKLNQLVQ